MSCSVKKTEQDIGNMKAADFSCGMSEENLALFKLALLEGVDMHIEKTIAAAIADKKPPSDRDKN